MDRDAQRVLPASEAWAIAVAWQDALQGRVQLVTDRDGPVDSIVESYAWVQIDGASCAVTRAAMLTWTALAACPGYSGSENAPFWKRVCSDLQESPHAPLPPLALRVTPAGVTDAHGFFDLPGHTFPRFKVSVPDPIVEDFYQVFTREGPTLEPAIELKLASILDTLRPYQKRLPVDPIDVCLWIDSTMHRERSRAITLLVHAVNDGITKSRQPAAPVTPTFVVCQIDFRDVVRVRTEPEAECFLSFVQETPVQLAHFNFSPTADGATREATANWLRAFLRLEGHCVQAIVSSFSCARDDLSDANFQALMSALPFARSTHSVHITTERFQSVDLPWIAYAIFHPCAASSSWRHLDLEDVPPTERSYDVLTAMKRGNNLLALLHGTPAENDAYYSAQLAPATTVFAHPHWTSEHLVSVVCPTVVDVCGITSLDPTSWSEWVAIVTPAYGLGYVRKHDVASVRKHSPCTQQPIGLSLRRRNDSRNEDVPPQALLHVLSPLGSRLTYLNIASYPSLFTHTLLQILCACPSLMVLAVCHNGAFWSEVRMDFLGTCALEEIELRLDFRFLYVVEPATDFLTTTLRHLRAVRLHVSNRQVDRLQGSQDTLQQLLTHASSLRYLHWRNTAADYTWTHHGRAIPYTHSVQWTPQALAQLELSDDQLLYVQQPLSHSCRVAFLSVVERSGASMSRLVDRGELTMIFAYAASRVRRIIHIEPNDKQSEPDSSPPIR